MIKSSNTLTYLTKVSIYAPNGTEVILFTVATISVKTDRALSYSPRKKIK